MKRNLKFIILAVIGCVLAFLSYSIYKKTQYKKEVAKRISFIPAFSFVQLNGQVFATKDLQRNKNTLFVYYNSECEYCQSEVRQIQENLVGFKNTQLIFISFEPMEDIQKFAIDYQFDHKPNVLFLQDSKLEFSEIFDANSIPFMLLYNPQQELLQKFKGATKIANVLKHLPN